MPSLSAPYADDATFAQHGLPPPRPHTPPPTNTDNSHNHPDAGEQMSIETNAVPIATYDISDPDDPKPSCCYTPWQHLVVLERTCVRYSTTRHQGGWCSAFSDGAEVAIVPYSEIGCITLVEDEDGLPVIFTDSELTPFAPFETGTNGGLALWRRVPLTLFDKTQAWSLMDELKCRMTANGLASGTAIYSASHIEDQIKPHSFKEYLRVRSQIAQEPVLNNREPASNGTNPHAPPDRNLRQQPRSHHQRTAGATPTRPRGLGEAAHSVRAEGERTEATAIGILGGASTTVGGLRLSANGPSSKVVSRPIGGKKGGEIQAPATTKEDVANRIRELRTSMHQGAITEIDYEMAKSAIARQALGSSWRSPSDQLAEGTQGLGATVPRVGQKDPRRIRSLTTTYAGSTSPERDGARANDPRTIHSLAATRSLRGGFAADDSAIAETEGRRQVSSVI